MKRAEKPRRGASDLDLGGIFRNLSGFVDLLSKVVEEGGEFTRSGNLGGADGASDTEEGGDPKKGVRAVYGFTVRAGGGGRPSIQPFGNVKVGADGPVVEETREPLVDVFDEDDHLLVVAELPGVAAKDIRFVLHDDVLDLTATHRDRKYHKEVVLPAAVDAADATTSFHNGVFELKLSKAK